MEDAFGTGTDDGFAGGFSEATAQVHALGAKVGIVHACGVGGKVVHGPLWDTACLPRFRRDGGQRLDRADERFALALFEQRAGVCSPGLSRCGAASKDGVSHVHTCSLA